MGALAWLHKIIMNHKIGIIVRLVMTNHISIIGIFVVANSKYFFLRTHSIKSSVVSFFS